MKEYFVSSTWDADADTLRHYLYIRNVLMNPQAADAYLTDYDDIRFVAGYDRRNQDGINLRNGCSEIAIENISGQTGDDMIALSAIDVPRMDEWEYLVQGRDDDIHDISIRNVTGAAVKLFGDRP